MKPFEEQNPAELIALFAQIRDLRSAAKSDFEERDKRAKEVQENITAELMKRMNDQGVDSIKAGGFTAYTQVTKKVSCGDWNALHDHVRETGNFDLLQKRVGSNAVQSYLEENDELPPGVRMESVREVRVRSS